MISIKCRSDGLISIMSEGNTKIFKNESGKNDTKRYSCEDCGNSFDANPPDDVCRFSSMFPCWNFDWVERTYKCSSCGNNIKLFWHPELHKHRDYTTLEEIEVKTKKDPMGNSPDYSRRMIGY